MDKANKAGIVRRVIDDKIEEAAGPPESEITVIIDESKPIERPHELDTIDTLSDVIMPNR